VSFGVDLYTPFYSLGGQSYIEVLAKYELRSSTRVLLEQFSRAPTSSNPVRVVTTGLELVGALEN
jgi:hypothetical protein